MPELTILPCGCVIEPTVDDGTHTVVYAACSTTCEYYLYARSEADATGKEVQVMYTPREDDL